MIFLTPQLEELEMELVPQDLLDKFRSPTFPGSYFLTLEGIEGSGKSTQITVLKDYFEELDFRVLLLREPGGTEYGEKLRRAILESQTEINPLSEAYLFASSRAQLLTEKILKELARPQTVVICDRYVDSSLAYQGVARKLGVKTILEIHQFFPLCLLPHLTIYLRIGLDTSHARQAKRNSGKDYFESQNDAFYNALIEGYENSANLFPNRVKVVDGEGTGQEVTQQIKRLVDELLKTS